jgi:hypothetical protein
MKLGAIGEEMVATAVALAKERDARVDALFVIVVPLDSELDARCTTPRSRRRRRSPRRVLLGEENGVASSRSRCARARSAGDRRQAERAIRPDRARLVAALAAPVAFFSPTVDYVLASARARCSSSPSRRRVSRTYSDVMKLVVIGAAGSARPSRATSPRTAGT